MKSSSIRHKFIHYFKSQGHAVVPSSPVAPLDDPTLLFINAGMNQFKEIFLGKDKSAYKRATSVQKCIRVGGKHNDLENVGHTKRHMTFFEMLGNFSFGDYFKEDAMRFAYEVSTQVFGFDPEKIYISVYEKDEESYNLWLKHVKPSQIVKLGAKDNFWSMGDTGPCGPCSELLYDRGPSFGSATSPVDDVTGERFLEFWNLVFMQYNRNSDGTLSDLPKPCVDTGAGLERVMSLIDDVPTVFQTDILLHLIAKIETVADVKYDPNNKELAPAFHVIADHIRTLCFSMSDGVDPSNVDRGYVLRKVLRRAVRYARRLGITKPFLSELVTPLIEVMGEDYPELVLNKKRMESLLQSEEKSFIKVLDRGGSRLKDITTKAQKDAKKTVSGKDAFTLKDTYGFPIEEILLIAKDEGVNVDMQTFGKLELEAKEKSRQAHKKVDQTASKNLFEPLSAQGKVSHFVGSETDTVDASIEAMLVGTDFVKTLKAGEKAQLVLDTTSFYPEKGGQVGDKGVLKHGDILFQVHSTHAPYSGIITHHGELVNGELTVGDPVVASIDTKRRREIEKHHSATHLLHYALQKVLGSHIKQAGSLVESDRLRFDFTHHENVSHEQVRELEALINKMIWQGGAVDIEEKNLAEIANDPSIKQFFGDKYGEKVRVVTMGKESDLCSKELCGGTHVQNLATIGYVRIASIKALAAGVKRAEVFLGAKAEETARYPMEDELNAITTFLKAKPKKNGTLDATTKMGQDLRELKQKTLILKQKLFASMLPELKAKIEKVGDKQILCACLDLDKEAVAEILKQLTGEGQNLAVLLVAEEGEQSFFFLGLSKDLIAQGYSAGTLMKPLLELVSGRGGGKADMARGSSAKPSSFDPLFQSLKKGF
ncbi:alanine--tRNA ligase [Candidatus Aerophobetes bacterium]|uniref:Alanine--tRNA ligase n=1 Tax=Aerophobetes bacterium TaxID=2030807 RepID=A0A2A4X4D9_UNCAE|nr:MAG: alanine--tRNA ligase [Candidatus Aerophobetes bacterium]